MDLDEPQSASVKTYAVKTQSLPELETYFGLLVLEYLVDQKNFGSVCVSCFFFLFFSFIVLKPWSSWTKFHSGHGIVPLLGGKRDFAQQEIPGPPSWKDLLQLLQLRRSAPKAGRNQKVFPFIQIAEVVLSFLTFVRFLFFLFFFASEASC